MSTDSCNLTIYIHPSDQAAVVEAFGVEPAECRHIPGRPQPLRLLAFDDIRPYPTLDDLARRGISCDGSHSEGATYPARRFAAHGGELAAIGQGIVRVPIDLDTLTVDEASLSPLRAYKRLHARAQAAFDHEPPQ